MNIISSILLSRGELINFVLQMEKPVLRQSGAWLVCSSVDMQCCLKLPEGLGPPALETPVLWHRPGAGQHWHLKGH